MVSPVGIIKKTLKVALGRNDPKTLTVIQDGLPVDFIASGVTKLGILINGVEYFSTDGYMTYDANGVITFKLGSIPSMTKGKYPVRLFSYTAQTPLGQPIYTEKTDFRLAVEFY
jgi:hypothetical protein